MIHVPSLSLNATAPINDVFSTVAMARDLLMACDQGRQSLTLEGPVAKKILETLISLADGNARAANPDVARRETAFSSLVKTTVVQGEREESVRDAWFMQDTPASGIR